VIVEALQRVLAPQPGFLEALREATQRHGVVLIFDEIVTGFRIAWGGAQDRYG
jgi:glutamate-1-semialdehyde 2,1-aminomutase